MEVGQLSQNSELPNSVKKAFGSFFELGVEAQDLALPLIEQATIERGRLLNNSVSVNERQAVENRWTDYLKGLGDKLATQLDPSYWAGHGGNGDVAVRARANFLRIFENQSADTLLQTKEVIEKVVGRK
jgi:hypothetical protein